MPNWRIERVRPSSVSGNIRPPISGLIIEIGCLYCHRPSGSGLKQIRSAGPASLLGRVSAGEKGAAVGAMFDNVASAIVKATARSAHIRSERHVPEGGNRAPMVDRRPPPARASAHEAMPNQGSYVGSTGRAAASPVGKGNAPNSGAVKPGVAYDPTEPRLAARTEPGRGVPHEATQPGAVALAKAPAHEVQLNQASHSKPAGNAGSNAAGDANNQRKPQPQTNPGGDTGAMDPDRVQRRAKQQERADLQALKAQREADLLRRVADANAHVAQVAPTMPRANESVSADRALDGMSKQGWPTVASMNGRRHSEAWHDAGGQGEPPVAFRYGNLMRVDFQRLSAEQQRRFEAMATATGGNR